MNNTTHFGFQNVPVDDKSKKVSDVFHSVAKKYDLMNDLMSFGVHRLWKRFAINISGVRKGEKVLDLAGGTGDLATKLSQKVGQSGQVIVADLNSSMLSVGRSMLVNKGIVGNIRYVQTEAENLSFSENYFQHVTIAFGLRNFTNIGHALVEIYRVLKPGGQLLVLEFSKPKLGLATPLYDFYSFKLLPKLGDLVVKDSESYRYLAESIRMHPDQEALQQMMLTAGFNHCEYFNLSAGIVALHRGYKL